MGINNWEDFYKTAETATDFQGSAKPTGFAKVKNSIVDKLNDAAKGLGEKAACQDAQPGIAQYGKQVSEWSPDTGISSINKEEINEE